MEREGRSLKGDWMLPGGEKLWAVQLEAGVWGGARLKDPSGQYKSRERRASSTSWCPLRMRIGTGD